MTTHSLYSPYQLGHLTLNNRCVMAPLTRNRANAEREPQDMNVTYYEQRASAGLIIAEATQICPEGQGYISTPGIYSEGQIEGWKKITNAVHQKNGKICLQLWHVGRISHSELLPNNMAPQAPSAIRAKAKTFNSKGLVDVSEPKALEIDEIKSLTKKYVEAALNANKAGFDMIEVHAANGYLIDQFLRDKTNHRTDEFGGSIENRARFLLEVIDEIIKVYPANLIGCRISPASTFNDIDDSDPQSLYSYVVSELGKRKIAYLHIIEGETGGPRDANPKVNFAELKKLFKSHGGMNIMTNNGYHKAMAESAIDNNEADLIAFGVPFLANPDLVNRLENNYPLNKPDQKTFYGGTEKGYTDYPFYNS
ncbi:alkene reductase [Candidatus Methylopumilus universalis]|jgi:N-ethylmaleimide reductase|uniref:alkene reductase n=1 Tax=Candidatus Methylopumilus universalis TaxID=2588536 RepID=UPI0011230755|nr:alkene reductase [Candidatus Methylopumilus universalis]QDC80808.1 alkene reductase [Candidatus Methylopumilus universalis]QDC82117.1 alkene reductase [Candidatus Methylopumilus universalis]QDC88551.1 alkene reductase [Candidatus Methylopumilus universalis]